jgi:hypothetical protein
LLQQSRYIKRLYKEAELPALAHHCFLNKSQKTAATVSELHGLGKQMPFAKPLAYESLHLERKGWHLHCIAIFTRLRSVGLYNW